MNSSKKVVRFKEITPSTDHKENEIVVISDDEKDEKESETSFEPWRDPELAESAKLKVLLKGLLDLPPLPPHLSQPLPPKHRILPLEQVKETIGVSGLPVEHQALEKDAGTKIVATNEKVKTCSPERRPEIKPHSPPKSKEMPPFPCASPPSASLPPPLPPPL